MFFVDVFSCHSPGAGLFFRYGKGISNIREANVVSRLDQAKEAERLRVLNVLWERKEELINRLTVKLVEDRLLEITSKKDVEDQLLRALDVLLRGDEFELQYQVAPFRDVVSRPHFVSLFLTAFVLEELIDHKAVVDIFGTDQDIYNAINSQVQKVISPH